MRGHRLAGRRGLRQAIARECSSGHRFVAGDVEIAKGRWAVAQLGQPCRERPGRGHVRVGHRVLVGRELHDLQVGVGTIPVTGLGATGCRALTLGLLQPLIERSVELVDAGGLVLDDLDEAHWVDLPRWKKSWIATRAAARPCRCMPNCRPWTAMASLVESIPGTLVERVRSWQPIVPVPDRAP